MIGGGKTNSVAIFGRRRISQPDAEAPEADDGEIPEATGHHKSQEIIQLYSQGLTAEQIKQAASVRKKTVKVTLEAEKARLLRLMTSNRIL